MCRSKHFCIIKLDQITSLLLKSTLMSEQIKADGQGEEPSESGFGDLLDRLFAMSQEVECGLELVEKEGGHEVVWRHDQTEFRLRYFEPDVPFGQLVVTRFALDSPAAFQTIFSFWGSGDPLWVMSRVLTRLESRGDPALQVCCAAHQQRLGNPHRKRLPNFMNI